MLTSATDHGEDCNVPPVRVVFINLHLLVHVVGGTAAKPMAINGMKLLRYVEHQGGIPLTQVSKNFQRKCVEWAAVEFQWPGYEPEKLYDFNKVLNELDFLPLSLLHSAFLDARLIRHFKGRAVLTKAGKALLGQHGELQAVLAEWILMTPDRDYVAREAMPLFWDISHMIGVISNRLHEWMTVGDLTEWLIPIELIETSGPLCAPPPWSASHWRQSGPAARVVGARRRTGPGHCCYSD